MTDESTELPRLSTGVHGLDRVLQGGLFERSVYIVEGPPGSGKSMLAHRLPGILPPMTEREALETATVASISAQGFRLKDWARRPFRAPYR